MGGRPKNRGRRHDPSLTNRERSNSAIRAWNSTPATKTVAMAITFIAISITPFLFSCADAVIVNSVSAPKTFSKINEINRFVKSGW